MADYTPEEIKAELEARGALPKGEAISFDTDADIKRKEFADAIGANHTPFDTIRNVLAGMGEAGQKIGNLMVKGVGMKPGPDTDIAGTLGAGNTTQDQFERGLGQYGVPALALSGIAAPVGAAGRIMGGMMGGGRAANAVGDVAAATLSRGAPQAAYMATQTDNPLEGAAMGFGGQGLAEAAPYIPGLLKAGAKMVGKGVDYLRPGKAAKDFLQDLSGVGAPAQPSMPALPQNATVNDAIAQQDQLAAMPKAKTVMPTKEQNVQSLAKDIQDAHQARLQDALSHKEPVFEQEGKSNIYKTPASALPEGNLDKFAHYIAPGEKFTADDSSFLSKQIDNYRKGKVGKESFNFDDFIDNMEWYYGKDLKPNQVKNLEDALAIPTDAPQPFLSLAEKNPKAIEGLTKDLYDKFQKNQTLNNADKLQSQLGDDLGFYQKKSAMGTLEPAEVPKMQAIKQMRDHLKADMQAHLERKNPAMAQEYKTYAQKYRENVVPYGEETATRDIVNEPKYVRAQRAQNPNIPFNVTDLQIETAFSQPSRDAMKVSGDIGETGRNKILFNLLAKDAKPDAKGLATSILQAKQSGGYSKYISPEMEKWAEELLKRHAYRNKLNIAAGIAGGSLLSGAAWDVGKKLI
jgi:hypothetical protein